MIAASRAGEASAYDTLYRRHAGAARSLARQLVRGHAEADDVVAETFARILDLLRRGGGPEGAFRPYLLTAVRRAAYDRHRAERRQLVTDELEAYDPGVPFADPAVAELERTMIAQAFASLPERWQAVLWHTEIEGARAAEVATLLGLTANGVAALAYRAREGLRQAYLQMHLSGEAREECRPVAGKLGAYVRGGLARRDAAMVAGHLDQCADCRRIYAELGDVNVALKAIVAPVVLGPAVAAYLASVGRGSAAGWVTARLAKTRHVVKGPHAAVVAAAVATVGLAAAAFALNAHHGAGFGPAAAHRALPPAATAGPASAAGAASAGNPAAGNTGAARPAPSRPHASNEPGPAMSNQDVPQPTVQPGAPSQPQGPSQRPGTPVQPAGQQPAPGTPAPPAASSGAPGSTGSTGAPVTPSAPPPAPPPPPAAAPGPGSLLTTQINPVGALPPGGTGIVGFSVANLGPVPALQVTANVSLPLGVSLMAGGTLGLDSTVHASPGGWTCAPVSSGARCTHGPLAAAASTTSYLQVAVAPGAPAGPPPAISVDSGHGRVTARGTTGVSAGGLPARFAASGRYAVTTAGARPGLGGYGAEARDRWLAPPCCTTGGDSARASAGAATRAGGQAATWAGRQAATWAGGQAAGKDEDNAVLALPGPVVWAGLYWASAGPVPRTSIALRGPDGPYRQVTGTATGSVVDLGVRGLPDVPVYQAFADVTSQVARYGAGAWSTVPLTAPGAAAGSLGWALVAVTEDGAAPPGQVMVLDGARPVDAAQPGFAAPLGGLMAGRSARVHVVEWTEHGPRAASFSQSLAGRPAVRFTPAGSPYLVGVITATGLPLPPASGARPGPQYPLHPVVTAFL